MSYRTLIEKNVVKAFNLLKDLAVTATLKKAPAKDFNFATASFPVVSTTDTTAKVLFITEVKKSASTNNLECKVLIKAPDIADLSTYDSVLVSGILWKLGPVISSNGFIYQVTLQRVP